MHFSANFLFFLVWCLALGQKHWKEGWKRMDWDIRYLFLFFFVTIEAMGVYRGIESD